MNRFIKKNADYNISEKAFLKLLSNMLLKQTTVLLLAILVSFVRFTEVKAQILLKKYLLEVKMKNIIFVLVAYVSLNVVTNASNIYPIFPNSESDISTAARILFQTQYPVNIDILHSTSPIVEDANGNFLSPHYLVVPTEYLNDPYRASYSVECELYVSEQNLITILPYKPFNYNTSYSVVFNDFPLMIPDINNPNGFYEHPESIVFENYFTTISFPLNFELSFENTHNLTYCSNDISVKFNKPIFVDDLTLAEMFSIIESETGNIISTEVLLSEDGMSVNLIPNSNLSEGVYFLQTNMADFTGDERLDRSHRFAVSEEIVITFKSNIDPDYRNSQYGYYSTFKYGDTVYFDTKFFLNNENNIFSDWELPGEDGINYTVDSNGTLKIIFDCDNYFYNNHLPTQQFSLTANYIENPVDTLILSFSPYNLSKLCDSKFTLNYELKGALKKIIFDESLLMFTYHKYSTDPIQLYNTINLPDSTNEPGGPGGTGQGGTNNICDISIDNFVYTSADGNVTIDSSGEINIERPIAPDNRINGMYLDRITGRWELDVTLKENNTCAISHFTMMINFVGENRDVFFNNNTPLISNSNNMFSVLEFAGYNLLNNSNNLFADDYRSLVQIKSVIRVARSVPYSIVIAPEYSDLYEIYNVVESDNRYNPPLKNWQHNPDSSSSSVNGNLATHSTCDRTINIQIRRKIVALDIYVHKKGQTTSVPTYNQAHLEFLNGDNQKALNCKNDIELLNHNDSNTIYGIRYKPQISQIFTNFSNNINVANEERTRYYFYADDKINAKPFIRNNTGYNFDHWELLPTGHNMIGTNTFEVTFNTPGIKIYNGVMLLGEGFRLEYIGVKSRTDAGEYIYYTVDDESNRKDEKEDKIISKWENNSTDADRGVGINDVWMVCDYHTYTTSFLFIFNESYNYSTIKDTVTGKENLYVKDDEPKHNGLIRYDGLPIQTQYIQRPDIWGVVGNNVWHLTDNTMQFQLGNGILVNGIDTGYSMSHLQPFSIKIDNVGGKIYSHNDNVLSNISKEKVASFRGISEPPAISIQTMKFINVNITEEHGGKNLYAPDIEVKIIGSLFVGTDGKKLPHEIENEFTILDEEERYQFYYKNKEYPSGTGTVDLGKNEYYGWMANFYTAPLLQKNTIIGSFHWLDDDEDWGVLRSVIKFGTDSDVLNLASDIFDLGLSNETTEKIQKFGEKITSAINDEEDVEYKGDNTFYLGFDDISLNSVYGRNGEKYDWELWGVGKTGMYKRTIREAYHPAFKHEISINRKEPEIKPINASVTQIEITIGDVWVK